MNVALKREVSRAIEREFKQVMYTNEYRFQWVLRRKSLPNLKIATGPLHYILKGTVAGNPISELVSVSIRIEHPSITDGFYIPYNLGSQEELKLLKERLTEALTRVLKKAIEEASAYETLTVKFSHRGIKNKENVNSIDGFYVSYPSTNRSPPR